MFVTRLHLLNVVEIETLLVGLSATGSVGALQDRLAARYVLALRHDSSTIRLVTHRHIQREHVPSIFEAFKTALTYGKQWCLAVNEEKSHE